MTFIDVVLRQEPIFYHLNLIHVVSPFQCWCFSVRNLQNPSNCCFHILVFFCFISWFLFLFFDMLTKFLCCDVNHAWESRYQSCVQKPVKSNCTENWSAYRIHSNIFERSRLLLLLHWVLNASLCVTRNTCNNLLYQRGMFSVS